MVEMLFQTFSPIIGHMIKIATFHHKVSEIFIFGHITNKLVEYLV